MSQHIHKRFADEQVKDLMKRYETGEISRAHIETILGIGQTRFFALVKSYRDNPEAFSISIAALPRQGGSARKLKNGSFRNSKHPKNSSTKIRSYLAAQLQLHPPNSSGKGRPGRCIIYGHQAGQRTRLLYRPQESR